MVRITFIFISANQASRAAMSTHSKKHDAMRSFPKDIKLYTEGIAEVLLENKEQQPRPKQDSIQNLSHEFTPRSKKNHIQNHIQHHIQDFIQEDLAPAPNQDLTKEPAQGLTMPFSTHHPNQDFSLNSSRNPSSASEILPQNPPSLSEGAMQELQHRSSKQVCFPKVYKICKTFQVRQIKKLFCFYYTRPLCFALDK